MSLNSHGAHICIVVQLLIQGIGEGLEGLKERDDVEHYLALLYSMCEN